MSCQRKRNKFWALAVCMLFLLLINGIWASAQKFDGRTFKDSLYKNINEVYPACIRAYGFDTVAQRQNSAQFSAVVVSPEGHILTVAHAIEPGSLYKISFPDGRKGLAKGLGRIVTDPQTTRPDVAMMKMIEDGPWPYAEMGWSSSLQADQFCFGISYPESLGLLKPMLRFGHILDPLDEWGFVQSTSIMETGDSGGPLFDKLGRVVALHSRINEPEDASFEVPVYIYRKYWTALNEPKAYDTLPQITNDIPFDPRIGELQAKNTQNTRAHEDIRAAVGGTTVRINSMLNTANQAIMGTVFDARNRKQIIVCKSSCIGQDPTIQIDSRKIKLRILYRDPKADLVALEAPVRLNGSLSLSKLQAAPLDDGAIGHRLYTLLANDSIKMGVLGQTVAYLPARFSSGGFGASLREQDGYPTVIRLTPNGPAEKAELAVGDQIFGIHDVSIASAQDFNREMMHYFPGDTVVLAIQRGKDSLSKTMVLIPRIHREQNHPMNRFKGGKSVRRDGFERVFLHDSRIHSYECGSPIFDVTGQFIGLNIARFSHVACVALEADVVRSFIETVAKL